MATTSGVSVTDFGAMSSSSGTAVNPKGVLDKDAFLMLFIEELKNQDPTSPMDSDKILTQTTQLTQLEANEEMKSAMKTITESINKSMNSNAQTSAIGMVDMMVDLGKDTVTRKDSMPVDFQLYFDQPVASGQIKITDNLGNLVNVMSLEDVVGSSGYMKFNWDGASDNGVYQADGDYHVNATYLDLYGNVYETKVGQGRVGGVKFENGNAMLRMGDSYVASSNVVEFRK